MSRKRAGKVLAFDTSNYTTSVAAADLSGNILADQRRLLTVKEGERGLRQSHALFQHVENLPGLLRKAAEEAGGLKDVCAIAVSERPRPVEGSYMPVFRAGVNMAESLSAVLDVPLYRFSHQEGHIAAICGALEDHVKTVSFHMSGGTGEILKTEGCRPLSVIGGIRDLSFGQLIDRAGVALGLGFPAGAALDAVACSRIPAKGFSYSSRGHTKIDDPATGPVHVKDAWANLSGIETQIMTAIEKIKAKPSVFSGENSGEQRFLISEPSAEKLVTELFCRIADSLIRLSVNALKEAETDTIIFVGGVSASRFLRGELERRLPKLGIRPVFGDPHMSSDNACGIALLGAAAAVTEE